MKVFVTGVGGQLGYDVMNELHQRGIESIGSDVLPEVTSIDAPYYSLDITDGAAVSAMLEKLKPDAVIHCAAWTAVDAAEDEDKQETVRKVNVEGTKNIAAECGALDIPMMLSVQIMCLTVRDRHLGSRTVRSMHRLMFMVKRNWRESLQWQSLHLDFSLCVSPGYLA